MTKLRASPRQGVGKEGDAGGAGALEGCHLPIDLMATASADTGAAKGTPNASSVNVCSVCIVPRTHQKTRRQDCGLYSAVKLEKGVTACRHGTSSH
eukprot:4108056-Amphidinium_carterae.1